MNADELSQKDLAAVHAAIDGALLETAARVLALQLIREFGVTVPRRALQAKVAAGQSDRITLAVLQKLEAVALVLGSP